MISDPEKQADSSEVFVVKTPIWRRVLSYRKYILMFTVPIFLLPLAVAGNTEAAKCGYVMLMMAIFWMTEALPIPVTSLLPLVLFPFMGIMPSKDVSVQYMKPTNVLLLGGLLVALAMERCDLHRRVALWTLKHVGTYPCWLLAGFMLPSWFLSHWISNTAASAMMVPVALAVIEESEKMASPQPTTTHDAESVVIEQLNYTPKENTENDNGELECDELKNDDNASKVLKQSVAADDELGASSSQFTSALLLSVSYACFIGGTASITGTPGNIIMKGVADSIYDRHGLDSPVTFTAWLAIGYPLSLMMIITAWLWLQVVFLGVRGSIIGYLKTNKVGEISERSRRISATINREYDKLGPIKFSEVATIVSFVLLLVFWFFRKPGFMSGWNQFFKNGYITTAVPTAAFGILMFIIPSRPFCSKNKENCTLSVAPEPLLTWSFVHRKMPWGVLLLMGGGLALAEGIVRSGLSAIIGNSLRVFGGLPGWLLVLCLSVIVAFITDFVSNPATATFILPIVATLAERLGMNPLYLMYPVAFASSMAFCLPVASPPAAIVFATGRVSIIQMIKTGIFLNFVCSLIITLATHTLGDAIFLFHVIPWQDHLDTSLLNTTYLNHTTSVNSTIGV